MKKTLLLAFALILPLLPAANDRVITTRGDSVALQQGGFLMVIPNRDYYRWDKNNPFENGMFVYSRKLLAFNQVDGEVTDIMLYNPFYQREIVRFNNGYDILNSIDTAVFEDGHTLFVHLGSLYFSRTGEAVKRPIGILESLSHDQLLKLHEEGSVSDVELRKTVYDSLAWTMSGRELQVTKEDGRYAYNHSIDEVERTLDLEPPLKMLVWFFAVWFVSFLTKIVLKKTDGYANLTRYIPVLAFTGILLSRVSEYKDISTVFGTDAFPGPILWVSLGMSFLLALGIPLFFESIIVKLTSKKEDNAKSNSH